MYDKILIPIALDHDVDIPGTIALARRLLADEGRITLVAVVEDMPAHVAEYATVKPAERIREDLKGASADACKGSRRSGGRGPVGQAGRGHPRSGFRDECWSHRHQFAQTRG